MKVLVGIDDSIYSSAAFWMVAQESWPPGTEIVLCSVISEYPIDPYLSGTHLDSLLSDAELWRYSTKQLVKQRESELQAAQPGCTITSIVAAGAPAQVLTDMAADFGSDLIVVGSHGAMRPQRRSLGSVADLVVGMAPCAVRVIRTLLPKDLEHASCKSYFDCNYHLPRTILWCVDSSESSKQAGELFARYNWKEPRELFILNVVQAHHDLSSLRFLRTSVVSAANRMTMDDALRSVEKRANRLRKKLETNKINGIVVEGEAVDVIPQQALKVGADLVVLSADSFHPESGLVGDVVETVVNSVSCSVEVFKPKAKRLTETSANLDFTLVFKRPRAYLESESSS